MKKRKLTWMLVLITALMTTACSNDENMPGSGGNDNGVITFTVTPDYGVKTRAGLDALPAGKALRCIMEVYNTSGAFVSREVKNITTISDPIEFTVEKKSENKTVVFWADFTTTGSPDADLYYKTDANSTYGLNAITFNTSNTTDFNGEAFYGNITLENGATATTNVTLTHAVAMVSLKTTTQLKNLQSVKVTYGDTNGNTNAPASVFNALDGTCTSAATIIQINKTIDATQTPNESAPYNFNSFYVFAPGTDKSLINMTMEMCSDDNGTTPMQTINVPNVPIRANYKTNITGDFAVQPNSFNITCEAEWATGELTPPAKWDGSIPTANGSYTFGGGTGDEATPYVIADSKDLAQLAANVNGGTTDYAGKYFKLANDLDLNNKEWTPIGTGTNNFKGNFNGGFHKISNLNLTNTTAANAGLFGYISNTNYSDLNGVIKNLHVSGNITNTRSEIQCLGGICGNANNSANISNCSFEGSITGAASNVGGICGKIGSGTTMCASKNSGNIISTNSSGYAETGGIAGDAASSVIKNCYNEGNIKGTKYVGGIVGYMLDAGAEIENCYNTGGITCTDDTSNFVGAICGEDSDSATGNCYVTASYKKTLYSNFEKIFANGTWPTWTANADADGTDGKGYWKSMGSWDATNPVYPTLWWE